MNEFEQPSLIPDSQEPAPDQGAEVIDISERARQIGENARPFEYEDRTSEAARDQGWGPVTGIEEVPGSEEERQKARNRGTHPSQKKPFELPGQNRGRSNTPGPATPAEAQQGMTTDEIATQKEINQRGVAVARQALNKAVRKTEEK